MATYEVYLGGPRQQNPTWGMFPSAPFSAANPSQPAVKERPIHQFIARNLDFTNDTALVSYNKTIVLANADKLGSVVIPANFLAIGFYWKVAVVNAGGTFAVGTRVGGTTLLAATTTGTLASGYVPWPSGPVLFPTSDIVDVTLTVPGGGMGALSLVVGVVGDDLRYGNW